MSIAQGLEKVMEIDLDILGGEPCFTEHACRWETVVDNLAAGHSVARILANFPTLTKEHVNAVLRWEGELAREAAGLEKLAS